MSGFCWPVRVYYEDTDIAGVVYYANYLKFMERSRTEWLRDLGFEQDNLKHEPGIIFVVRNIEVDYLRPAHFNDALTVFTIPVKIRSASMIIDHEVRRQDISGSSKLLARGSAKLACLDVTSFKPVAVPGNILEAVTRVS